MIPELAPLRQIPAWQRELANAIRDPAELLQILDLDPALLPAALASAALFPLRVPRSYVARIIKGDPFDPLLRQALPLAAETSITPGFLSDPVGDQQAMVTPGVIHKYRGRVLLIATGACAIHCRYCFRREFPYAEANPRTQDWHSAIDYVSSDASISEVIVSGGDPLSLTNQRLGGLMKKLAAIPHLRRLRIHSRLPIVVPERIDPGLLELLANSPLQTVLVVHANHPREIDASVSNALHQLTNAGVSLLNQSVLLKGVNDSAKVLAALSDTLFRDKVMPYYLHLLDRVRGTAHFEVEQERAVGIIKEMRSCLPGYLVPRLVREQAGEPAKTLVA